MYTPFLYFPGHEDSIHDDLPTSLTTNITTSKDCVSFSNCDDVKEVMEASGDGEAPINDNVESIAINASNIDNDASVSSGDISVAGGDVSVAGGDVSVAGSNISIPGCNISAAGGDVGTTIITIDGYSGGENVTEETTQAGNEVEADVKPEAKPTHLSKEGCKEADESKDFALICVNEIQSDEGLISGESNGEDSLRIENIATSQDVKYNVENLKIERPGVTFADLSGEEKISLEKQAASGPCAIFDEFDPTEINQRSRTSILRDFEEENSPINRLRKSYSLPGYGARPSNDTRDLINIQTRETSYTNKELKSDCAKFSNVRDKAFNSKEDVKLVRKNSTDQNFARIRLKKLQPPGTLLDMIASSPTCKTNSSSNEEEITTVSERKENLTNVDVKRPSFTSTINISSTDSDSNNSEIDSPQNKSDIDSHLTKNSAQDGTDRLFVIDNSEKVNFSQLLSKFEEDSGKIHIVRRSLRTPKNEECDFYENQNILEKLKLKKSNSSEPPINIEVNNSSLNKNVDQKPYLGNVSVNVVNFEENSAPKSESSMDWSTKFNSKVDSTDQVADGSKLSSGAAIKSSKSKIVNKETPPSTNFSSENDNLDPQFVLRGKVARMKSVFKSKYNESNYENQLNCPSSSITINSEHHSYSTNNSDSDNSLSFICKPSSIKQTTGIVKTKSFNQSGAENSFTSTAKSSGFRVSKSEALSPKTPVRRSYSSSILLNISRNRNSALEERIIRPKIVHSVIVQSNSINSPKYRLNPSAPRDSNALLDIGASDQDSSQTFHDASNQLKSETTENENNSEPQTAFSFLGNNHNAIRDNDFLLEQRDGPAMEKSMQVSKKIEKIKTLAISTNAKITNSGSNVVVKEPLSSVNFQCKKTELAQATSEQTDYEKITNHESTSNVGVKIKVEDSKCNISAGVINSVDSPTDDNVAPIKNTMASGRKTLSGNDTHDEDKDYERAFEATDKASFSKEHKLKENLNVKNISTLLITESEITEVNEAGTAPPPLPPKTRASKSPIDQNPAVWISYVGHGLCTTLTPDIGSTSKTIISHSDGSISGIANDPAASPVGASEIASDMIDAIFEQIPTGDTESKEQTSLKETQLLNSDSKHEKSTNSSELNISDLADALFDTAEYESDSLLSESPKDGYSNGHGMMRKLDLFNFDDQQDSGIILDDSSDGSNAETRLATEVLDETENFYDATTGNNLQLDDILPQRVKGAENSSISQDTMTFNERLDELETGGLLIGSSTIEGTSSIEADSPGVHEEPCETLRTPGDLSVPTNTNDQLSLTEDSTVLTNMACSNAGK